MSVGLALALATIPLAQVPLPGTQPNQLTYPVAISETCGCHQTFDSEQMSEPGQSYRATLMANSARDPVFRAAFQVARQDKPQLTDLCLRCHAPVGWLNGRSEGELTGLEPEDLSSVTCDLCHRMVPAEPLLIGSGQYTIADDVTKRSSRGMAPPAGHNAIQFDFTASSELCAPCHSLFNPAELSHDDEGNILPGPYYEQRTYEEWRDSAFGTRNQTCIACHMERVEGAAVLGGGTYSNLHVHGFVGGNSFAVKAIQMLNPTLPIGPESEEVVRWVARSLARSAELTIETPKIEAYGGREFELPVKLLNKTGHKLPSGYPEGRRVYLEVNLLMPGQAPQVLSGQWNTTTGDLVPDPQLRTYETQHGRYEDGVSTRTHHLLLMNQIISDTRIPPEGFRPSAGDMVPMGRDYGAAAPYRHWDEFAYKFTAPEVTGPVQATLVVRAKYQVIDGELYRFLTETAAGTPEADDLMLVYQALDKAPPELIDTASVALELTVAPAPPPTDAGFVVVDPEPLPEEGCTCTQPPRRSWGSLALLLGPVGLLWRRRWTVRARPC
ncbi:MAG: hypothetical protein IPG45_04320 [Deltaproteobacteria bacterium]|nr:hypothetical protein [Deltaproteobacteria bacterium]